MIVHRNKATRTTPAIEALEQRRLCSGLPHPDHIVVVVEENRSYSDIVASTSTPYIHSLFSTGALFTRSYAVAHPSQPNYLALFSGSTQGIVDDSTPHTFARQNLGSQLLRAGKTFTGYSEDLPSVGFTGDSSGAYRRKHNPWVNFPNVHATDSQPLSAFPSDLSKLPALSFVIPNQNNDMHDGSVRGGDTWLKKHLGAYVTWARTHNSLLVVTWDEDDGSSSNRIPTLFVGPMVKPGRYAERINHYNVLRTLEDLTGLPHAGAAAQADPITDVWRGSV